MSRDGRDDARADALARAGDRAPDRPTSRAGLTRRPGLPMDGLTLPRGDRREVVEFRDRPYHLRGSDTRILATVGTFRVVAASDLDTGLTGSPVRNGDLRHLAAEGLIRRESAVIRPDSRHVVVLTREGKALLDAHQQPHTDGRQQEYYATLVRPSDLVHNAQLYRLYQAEAAQIDEEGGRVTRVVIDDELKRDYQRFLHRAERSHDADHRADIWTFARAQDLAIVDGHLQLPDVRIEYETDDGRLTHRDVELVTDHYSRAQVAGKAKAGFALYHAAGVGRQAGRRTDARALGARNLE